MEAGRRSPITYEEGEGGSAVPNMSLILLY
jgi:hypothetical protein